MTAPKTEILDFTYNGRLYNVAAESAHFGGAVIINKLNIGNARYWLIISNDQWRLIADMPLCPGLKQALAAKIFAWHGLQDGNETDINRVQDGKETAILKFLQRFTGGRTLS